MGRGAFGKVHKGVLRELPKAEVFFKPREERVDIKEERVIAIKVLLGEALELIYTYNGPFSMFKNSNLGK